MWYELENAEILELKEFWKSGEAGEISWEEFWEDNLYWHTILRDKQKNYKRNGDIVYNQKTRKYKDKEIGYILNRYIPDFSISSRCLIMDWNE